MNESPIRMMVMALIVRDAKERRGVVPQRGMLPPSVWYALANEMEADGFKETQYGQVPDGIPALRVGGVLLYKHDREDVAFIFRDVTTRHAWAPDDLKWGNAPKENAV